MKQCLRCEGVSQDQATHCARCRERLDYFRPASASRQPDTPAGELGPDENARPKIEGFMQSPPQRQHVPKGEISTLAYLGALFYISAAGNAAGGLVSRDDEPFIIFALFVAGMMSSAFFGAICFAVNDIRSTLYSIERRLNGMGSARGEGAD